jgi:hypothetical protein
MIPAVLAYLQRFFEVGFEERGIALKTLDEDTFGLNASLLGRYGFDRLILFTKPCDKKTIAKGSIFWKSSQ